MFPTLATKIYKYSDEKLLTKAFISSIYVNSTKCPYKHCDHSPCEQDWIIWLKDRKKEWHLFEFELKHRELLHIFYEYPWQQAKNEGVLNALIQLQKALPYYVRKCP